MTVKKFARREVCFSSVTHVAKRVGSVRGNTALSSDRGGHRQIIAQLEAVKMTNVMWAMYGKAVKGRHAHTRVNTRAHCVKLHARRRALWLDAQFARPVLFPHPRTELLAQFIFFFFYFSHWREKGKWWIMQEVLCRVRTGLWFVSRRSARNAATFRIRVSSINHQLVNCGFDRYRLTHPWSTKLIHIFSFLFFLRK